MWALGLSAVAAVFALERRVDDRVRAQLVTAQLRKEISDLSPLAFSSNEGLPEKAVQARLDAAERHIGADAARLGELAGDQRDTARLIEPARAMFRILAQVNTLASAGRMNAASAVMGKATRRGAPESALARVFSQLNREYNVEAVSARRLAEAGTLFAVVAVLLAFSFALHRATTLARERDREALTDELTGLANRRQLFSEGDCLLCRGLDPRESVAVGMFDLDGFKVYNDTFGHPAGDALLARFGLRLEQALGANGVAYRIGGDEFCAVTHGPNAEALLKYAQTALIEHLDGVTVSCSLGSTVITGENTPLELALHQADQRLYTNKRLARTSNGREAHELLLRASPQVTSPKNT